MTGDAQNLSVGRPMKTGNDEPDRSRKTGNTTSPCRRPAYRWRNKKLVAVVTTATISTMHQGLHHQHLPLARTVNQALSCLSAACKPKGLHPHHLDNRRIRLRSWPHPMGRQHMERSRHLLLTDSRRRHLPASLRVLAATKSRCLLARSSRSMSQPSSLLERPRTTTSRQRRPSPRRNLPRSRRRPA